MKIVAHLNPLFRPQDFEMMLSSQQEIDGISLNITSTKDGRIVVFEPRQDVNMTVSTIQNNTVEDLKELEVRFLETFLNYFRQYGKKIVLNVLPLYYPPLSENTVAMIRKMNLEYVIHIQEIISKFPFLNLYLCSTNQNIVNHMKDVITRAKVGLTVQEDNFTFIDTDFYKLPVSMLDLTIIEEQLQKGKEIMVAVLNCADMAILLDYFHQHQDEIRKKAIFKQLIYDCYYPEIFYLTFREKA